MHVNWEQKHDKSMAQNLRNFIRQRTIVNCLLRPSLAPWFSKPVSISLWNQSMDFPYEYPARVLVKRRHVVSSGPYHHGLDCCPEANRSLQEDQCRQYCYLEGDSKAISAGLRIHVMNLNQHFGNFQTFLARCGRGSTPHTTNYRHWYSRIFKAFSNHVRDYTQQVTSAQGLQLPVSEFYSIYRNVEAWEPGSHYWLDWARNRWARNRQSI